MNDPLQDRDAADERAKMPSNQHRGVGETPPTETVLFLSGDLMFASRVRGAAERAGLAFRLSGTLPDGHPGPEQPPDQPRFPDRPRFVVLDLATRGTLVSELVEWAAMQSPPPQVIAYGPHVQVERLRAAREAGIERVMTRSQFDSQLTMLFATL